MVPKCELLESIPLHGQGFNYETCICELEDHVGEMGLNLNWLTKLGTVKETLLVSFPSHLLKSNKIESTFPYALSPRHEGAKQDTNGVARSSNAKLSHYTSPMLVYPMENKMSPVHHVVE
jgi:hypothetical protein